ncbi:hypothetical protein V1638_02260 [Pseudarthrobacter sp. J64]|nr:hypothetical protein [Pseudarthrobacter sp. J64]
MDRERRYLERLRAAEIPAASTDFTARLLERTHVLAAAPEPASAPHGFAVRVVAVSASGALAAAGVLTATALLMAGDPAPMAERPTSVSALSLLSPAPAEVPANGGSRDNAAGAAGAMDAGSAERAMSRTLSAADLDSLRESGWACPALEDLGFRVVSAKAVEVQDAPALELHLSNGTQRVTVVEQRDAADPASAADGPPVSSVPVNLQTGRSAVDDGFVAVPELLADSGAAGGSAAVWVRAAEPMAMIYRSRTATLSFYAEAGHGAAAPDHVAALVEMAHADAAAGQGVSAAAPVEAAESKAVGAPHDEPLTERLARGFRHMLGLPVP